LEKRTRIARGDSSLQVSRRIDWRFLLPNPELRRVAYIGFNAGNLLNALKEFSESLSFIAPPSLERYTKENRCLFDLVVVRSLRLNVIKEGVKLIKPNGYLYWELDRVKWFRSSRRRGATRQGSVKYAEDCKWKLNSLLALRSTRNYNTHLKQLGLNDVELHWHRPNFDQCTEIIPLNNEVVLSYIFEKAKHKYSYWLRSPIRYLLPKNNILTYIVPYFSVVARQPSFD
jgi:hypothetical protein